MSRGKFIKNLQAHGGFAEQLVGASEQCPSSQASPWVTVPFLSGSFPILQWVLHSSCWQGKLGLGRSCRAQQGALSWAVAPQVYEGLSAPSRDPWRVLGGSSIILLSYRGTWTLYVAVKSGKGLLVLFIPQKSTGLCSRAWKFLH